MPSIVHGVITELLEQHPETLSYLLALSGVVVSAPLVPAPETRGRPEWLERRNDRTFLVGSGQAPRGFVIAEVQTRIDPDKRFSWPLSLEMARTRYRCEGALVVLSTSASVRAWLLREIARPTGMFGSTRMLSPSLIALDELDRAALLRADRPLLAKLSVAAHASSNDLPTVAEEAIRIAVESLPERLATAELDVILGLVDRALRVTLEKKLMEHPRFRSVTFRKWYAQATREGRLDGLREGRREGWIEGLAQGKAKGLAEGKAKGLAEGKAKSIIAVLNARGINVSIPLRDKLTRCTDLKQLDEWLERAAIASSASAVIRPARGVESKTSAASKRNKKTSAAPERRSRARQR